MTYNASDIRILEPAEVNERFTWARVAALADQYRKPAAWIGRGLEACRRAGIDDAYFVERYLQRLDIPRHDGADEAMRDLVRGDRYEPDQPSRGRLI